MTHTLHRLGTIDNLKNDYVVFAMSAKGINEDGSHRAIRRFMELAFDLDPVNAGDTRTSNIFSLSIQEILEGIRDTSVVHAVFTDSEQVTKLLKLSREEDLGISVIVSGLFEKVEECAREASLNRHTVECSLGVWGKISSLADTNVLQVTTMCGHSLISGKKVNELARLVRKGRLTSKKAAEDLARTCICGIFNPIRASQLLETIAFENRIDAKLDAGQTKV